MKRGEVCTVAGGKDYAGSLGADHRRANFMLGDGSATTAVILWRDRLQAADGSALGTNRRPSATRWCATSIVRYAARGTFAAIRTAAARKPSFWTASFRGKLK